MIHEIRMRRDGMDSNKLMLVASLVVLCVFRNVYFISAGIEHKMSR